MYHFDEQTFSMPINRLVLALPKHLGSETTRLSTKVRQPSKVYLCFTPATSRLQTSPTRRSPLRLTHKRRDERKCTLQPKHMPVVCSEIFCCQLERWLVDTDRELLCTRLHTHLHSHVREQGPRAKSLQQMLLARGHDRGI